MQRWISLSTKCTTRVFAVGLRDVLFSCDIACLEHICHFKQALLTPDEVVFLAHTPDEVVVLAHPTPIMATASLMEPHNPHRASTYGTILQRLFECITDENALSARTFSPKACVQTNCNRLAMPGISSV
jgi:hypothetical protein